MAHEARLSPNASANVQYGFTCVFITDAGDYEEYSRSVGEWKKCCFQCAYLRKLRDYVSAAQMAQDTAINAARVEEMKDKLKVPVNDHRAVSQENDEMKASLRDLKESVSMLQGEGVESQMELAAEREKRFEAHRASRL